MLNELIGAVVQALFFSLIPLAVWYVTARKKESFFSWIGLKKPVCSNVAITILSAIVMTLLYIAAMRASVKILPDGVTTAGSQFVISLRLPVHSFDFCVQTGASFEFGEEKQGRAFITDNNS